MGDRVSAGVLNPISRLLTTFRRMIRLIAPLGRRSPRQLSLTLQHSYSTPGKILDITRTSSLLEQNVLGIHNMSVDGRTTPQASVSGGNGGEEPKVNRPTPVSSGASSFSKFLPHAWVQRASAGNYKFKGGGDGQKGRKSPSKTHRQGGHKDDTGDKAPATQGKPGGGQPMAEAPQKKRARVNSSSDGQESKSPASPPIEPSCQSEAGKEEGSNQEDTTPTRGWYHLPTHYNKRTGPGFDFSLMSYNVLAQELLTANWYLYLQCEDQMLTWDVRKEKLLQEFKHYDVDVLCLQEVQESHYHDFYLPELQKLGYEGLYKKRTGDKPDGCATFYKTSKFNLVNHSLVEYYRPNTYVLDRDNVAVVVLLQPKAGRRKAHTNLCIANTHLLFNKKRGDVKLSQLGVLLAEIDKMTFDPKVRFWDALIRCHPVVLCGDLNSEPYSPLYHFVNRGRLEYCDYEKTEISGQCSPPRWRNWMERPLWPAFIGITDHCQYYQAKLERRQQAALANMEKDGAVTSTSAMTQQPSAEAPVSSPVSVSSGETSNQGDLPDPGRSEDDQSSCGDPVEQPSVPSNNFSSSEAAVTEGNSQNLPSPSESEVSELPPQMPPFSSCIVHPFNLRSVYTHFTASHEPEATTHHDRANCTVDYIFYTARRNEGEYVGKGKKLRPKYRDGKLKLLSRLSLLSDRELEKMGTLPNKEHPSDHLPLIAKFRLTEK